MPVATSPHGDLLSSEIAWSQASIGPLEVIPADRISDALNASPLREGSPPTTPDGIPHQQHDQNAPLAMQQRLMSAIFTLPGILVVPTPFSTMALEEELRTIWIIAQVSYYFARGVSMESSTAITPASLGEVKERVR